MPKSLNTEAFPAPTPLARFQVRLEEPPPEPSSLQPLLRELEAGGQLEAALRLLRVRHPGSTKEKGRGWGAIRARLEVMVALGRDRRMAQWQHDPRRRLLRLVFEVRGSATVLNPSALSNALAQAFLKAGLPIAMGLEKTPRPLLQLGHPLPLGAQGLREWADTSLREPLSIPLEALPSLLNHHTPEGLRVLQAEEIPTLSTPVSDLCHRAHWCWPCPEALLTEARRRVGEFLEAERFEIEKSGKVGGQKTVKRADIRSHVQEARWDGADLHLTMTLAAGAALNPQKLLAGILGLEPAQITGLTRLEVEIRPDPKLKNRYRYETKLSNLYEDAVLLESGEGLTAPEDEEDDTTLLGR